MKSRTKRVQASKKPRFHVELYRNKQLRAYARVQRYIHSTVPVVYCTPIVLHYATFLDRLPFGMRDRLHREPRNCQQLSSLPHHPVAAPAVYNDTFFSPRYLYWFTRSQTGQRIARSTRHGACCSQHANKQILGLAFEAGLEAKRQQQ